MMMMLLLLLLVGDPPSCCDVHSAAQQQMLSVLTNEKKDLAEGPMKQVDSLSATVISLFTFAV